MIFKKIKHQQVISQKMSQKIAEETQLLVEEKWLLEAMYKIKKQRNSLQIERLHIKSLKIHLKHRNDAEEAEHKTPSPTTVASTPSAIDVMQKQKAPFSDSSNEFEMPMAEEILDLKVPKPNYGQIANSDDNMEEYDNDDDDEDCDNVFIDMNMLMNGKTD